MAPDIQPPDVLNTPPAAPPADPPAEHKRWLKRRPPVYTNLEGKEFRRVPLKARRDAARLIESGKQDTGPIVDPYMVYTDVIANEARKREERKPKVRRVNAKPGEAPRQYRLSESRREELIKDSLHVRAFTEDAAKISEHDRLKWFNTAEACEMYVSMIQSHVQKAQQKNPANENPSEQQKRISHDLMKFLNSGKKGEWADMKTADEINDMAGFLDKYLGPIYGEKMSGFTAGRARQNFLNTFVKGYESAGNVATRLQSGEMALAA
jgi:hypothetical protein